MASKDRPDPNDPVGTEQQADPAPMGLPGGHVPAGDIPGMSDTPIVAPDGHVILSQADIDARTAAG